MAKKTTMPAPAISIDAAKEQVKTCLTSKDAQGKPVIDKYLTDSQRTWLTVEEITDVLKITDPDSKITKALVVKAVTDLVQESTIRHRVRHQQSIHEYTSTHEPSTQQ